jgi:hypothetical protein
MRRAVPRAAFQERAGRTPVSAKTRAENNALYSVKSVLSAAAASLSTVFHVTVSASKM